MIRLNCFFTSNEGRFDEALDAARQLTAASLKHEGCISYDVYVSATRTDEFIIVETWQDEASLAAHSATAEFTKYVAIIEDCGTLKLEQLPLA